MYRRLSSLRRASVSIPLVVIERPAHRATAGSTACGTFSRGDTIMKRQVVLIAITLIIGMTIGWLVTGQQSPMKKWQKGKGWGWVWSKEDEVGALNEMTDASRLAALRLADRGKIYDLGVLYDRTSYKWPGHSPGEILSFRTPEGVKRQRDLPDLVNSNDSRTAWHSAALFIND